MSTVANILVATRAYVATVPTSRDAVTPFKEHLGNEPFEKSPLAGFDGFEIVAQTPTLTRGFGLDASKEGTFAMIVKLGHSEGATDSIRELLVQNDIARLADLIEAYQFPTIVSPDAIREVFFEGATTTKADANWWLTEMRFSVLYIGPKELV